ncbi:SPASM domain-containing protein [Aquimarina longa]|uniref:SPASM domain-containing protein n=1 Tax=Aquimarina longa TaxID=1080221 RepID=UPI0007829604|nr:SPASM domain-containing protein [Aquimarina longa]
MTNTYFLLFPSCVPVNGTKVSIIMDLDKGTYLEIPNLLHDILSIDLQRFTIHEIMKKFDHQYDQGIKEYFQFLVDNQYGFYTKDPKPFRKPEDIFYSPYKIISSVLAINTTTNYDLPEVLKQLDRLSCQLLQIRIYDPYDMDKLFNSLSPLKGSSIKICEVYVCYYSLISEEQLITICKEYPNVIIVVHTSKEKKQINISDEFNKKIVFTGEQVHANTKEVYDPSLFTISHSMYYESRHFNSGLHRKVCIDTDGSIKNYLSHTKVYGNIKENKISEIITKPKFQERYFITNDQIEKCKSCQFRYMCVSNSDIIKKNGKYFKKHTCNMDF